MEAAAQIRSAVDVVSLLRKATTIDPGLRTAVGEVKRLQARRFAGTYADILGSGPFSSPAMFFLNELYSDKDYSQRDAQFSRIAGAIEKLFPASVSEVAVALAQLHALTEELDHALAAAWTASKNAGLAPSRRYVSAWRDVGRREERETQLASVLDVAGQLARLTRKPGLRATLRMMRAPASAAGMRSLQNFLENGFDTFAAVARQPENLEAFVRLIKTRESKLIALLFEADIVAYETQLSHILGEAP